MRSQPATVGVSPARGRLGRRLLIRVLSVAAGLTVLLTFGQLAFEFHEQRRDLALRVEEIRRVSLPGLTESLWTLDERQLQLQLDGLVALPQIDAVELVEFADGESAPLRLRAGAGQVPSPIHWRLPLQRSQSDGVIGELRLTGSLAPLLEGVVDRGLTMLLVQGV